jgi:hypothetical protein
MFNNGPENQAPPLPLDARRTLIIGLGSTGSYICNQILEHLEWAYGSPKNVPWVRCLALETEDVPAGKTIHKYGKVEYLRLKADSYEKLIDSPSGFSDSIDFPAWNNPTVTGSHSAIAYGANNTRMLGRIALLYPENFALVENVIRQEKQKLDRNSLALGTAQKAFSEAFGRPVNLTLPDQVFVYVVGTLCGGTGSGGFIDLGYLLQEMGFPTATGIFTLPANKENNQRFVANSVSALVELNHFSDDRNRYQVRWPAPFSRSKTFSPGQTPYHHTYLMQSEETGPDAYRQLMTSIADYIYADLIGPTAAARDGKRVNISSWFNERDTEGATQRFFTFGLNSIEFPVVRVSNACQVRLMKLGLEQMIGGPQDSETIAKNHARGIKYLNRDALVLALATPSNSISLFDAYHGVINEAELNATQSKDPTLILRDASEQLNTGFSRTGGTPHPKIDTDCVKTTLESNALKVQEQLLADIRQQVEAFLVIPDDLRSDFPAGIELAQKFLAAVLEVLSKKFPDGRDALQLLEEQMAQTVRQVDECYHDAFVRFTLQRKSAVGRHLGEWSKAATDFYDQRIRVIAAPIAEARRVAVEREVQRMLDRISDAGVGLVRRTRQRIEELENLFASLDSNTDGDNKWTRRVNGLELFTSGQGGTIDQEYERCLMEEIRRRNIADDAKKVERRLARFTTHDYFREAVGNITKSSVEPTLYDAISENRALPLAIDKLMALTTSAEPYFASIRHRTVVERLMLRSDKEALIKQAATPERKFALDWYASSPRFKYQSQKYYHLRSYSTEPENPDFEALLENEKVDMPLVTILDKHQILFLREQGAFSLATIEELQDLNTPWWKSYLSEREMVHARADIAGSVWTAWHVDNDDYAERLRALFLTGVATDLCTFVGGTQYRFEYPRRGMRDLGHQDFGNDLMDVVNQIRTADLEGLIQLSMSRKIEDEGGVAIVDAMEKIVMTMESERQKGGIRFFDGGQPVSTEEIEMYFKSFVYRHPELQQAFEAKFPNIADTQYVRRDANGVVWYHCPHCSAALGKSPLNLRYYDSTQKRYVRKCQYCNKGIA